MSAFGSVTLKVITILHPSSLSPNGVSVIELIDRKVQSRELYLKIINPMCLYLVCCRVFTFRNGIIIRGLLPPGSLVSRLVGLFSIKTSDYLTKPLNIAYVVLVIRLIPCIVQTTVLYSIDFVI